MCIILEEKHLYETRNPCVRFRRARSYRKAQYDFSGNSSSCTWLIRG